MPEAFLYGVGGKLPTLAELSVSANGTYNASDYSVDGFSVVNVSVQGSEEDPATEYLLGRLKGTLTIHSDLSGYISMNNQFSILMYYGSTPFKISNSYLTSIYAPNLSILPDCAGCKALTSITLASEFSTNMQDFGNKLGGTALSIVDFPCCTSINGVPTTACHTLSLPNCSYLGQLGALSNLVYVDLPNVSSWAGSLSSYAYLHKLNYLNMPYLQISYANQINQYYGTSINLRYASRVDALYNSPFLRYINCENASIVTLGTIGVSILESIILGSSLINFSLTGYINTPLSSLYLDTVVSYYTYQLPIVSYNLPVCKSFTAGMVACEYFSAPELEYFCGSFIMYLSSIVLENCVSIASGAFYASPALRFLSLPKLSTIPQNTAFTGCIRLQEVILDSCSIISNSCFTGCYNLISLTLKGSTVCTLGTNCFTNTPIASSMRIGIFGSIYVPSSLYDTYKTATNWIVFSDRFVGI